jgi:hypothetical protein
MWQGVLDLSELWEADVEIPGVPQPYAIANGAIKSHRDAALASLRTRHPDVPISVLTATLESFDWRPDPASRAVAAGAAGAAGAAAHARVRQLGARFPSVRADLLLPALQWADFDLETAALLLTDEGLRARLAGSSPAREGAGGRRDRAVMTVDLLGGPRAEPRRAVAEALDAARADPHTRRVNFVTGQRDRSSAGAPLLKPKVLALLAEFGCDAAVMAENPGVVQAFIREPPRASCPAGSCPALRGAEHFIGPAMTL